MNDANALTAEELALIGDDEAGKVTPDAGKVPEWAKGVTDESLKPVLAKFESQDKLFEAIGYKPPKVEPADWREGLPEELKKTAEQFTSKEDALRAVVAFRKRESQIRVPGKDATDAERAAYLKAVGVPVKPEDYEFPVLPDEELTEEIKVSRGTWAKRFHDLGIPKDTAKALIQAVQQDGEKLNAATVEADKAFAKAQEEALRNEWKGPEFEKNHTLANRAFAEVANRAGLNVEDLRKIETKDGRFLMDRAEVVRIFALIGREMAEGTLGPTLTDAEMETLEDELRAIRKQIAEAQGEGNSKRADALYKKEQTLIARKQGTKPVVGAAGRSV